jgi:hypothetical protein
VVTISIIFINYNAGIEVNLTVLTDCDIETDSEHNLKLLICLLHMTYIRIYKLRQH